MDNQLAKIRHSLSHLMATAVIEQFPEAKLAIGPVIDNGFYYDFDLPRALTPHDLPQLEKRMKKMIGQNITFVRIEKSVAEAKQLSVGQPYKLELIDELAKNNQPISYYQSGRFTDLCAGPHVASSKEINADAFKLTSIAGAYWRGDEKNKMLQRIYGVAFTNRQELDEYLKQQEEAKKRDHRKLGAELGIFSFHTVAPGAPFWHPAGMIIFRELEKYWRAVHDAAGYQEISTPIMVKKELWEQSGHWQHYKENMFIIKQGEEIYSLKPMNCPEGTIVYSIKPRSYRELPLRLSEIGRLYRNEISGALGGLFRVRQITMDDAHIFCTPQQIESEITNLIKLIKSFYKVFNLPVGFNVSTMPDDHLGDAKIWERAESALCQALKKNKFPFTVKEKDGAFYGPKIDIQISDALNRSWQVATIQLDFNLPERFSLEYTDEKGKQQRPVMIHRAIYGSFERFIGILIEHYAGAFPLWLSPVQVQILTVGKAHKKFGKKIHEQLLAAGIRSHLDDGNDTVGYKIRQAEKMKVPYILVIGDKEMKGKQLAVRLHGVKQIKKMSAATFIKQVQKKIAEKK